MAKEIKFELIRPTSLKKEEFTVLMPSEKFSLKLGKTVRSSTIFGMGKSFGKMIKIFGIFRLLGLLFCFGLVVGYAIIIWKWGMKLLSIDDDLRAIRLALFMLASIWFFIVASKPVVGLFKKTEVEIWLKSTWEYFWIGFCLMLILGAISVFTTMWFVKFGLSFWLAAILGCFVSMILFVFAGIILWLMWLVVKFIGRVFLAVVKVLPGILFVLYDKVYIFGFSRTFVLLGSCALLGFLVFAIWQWSIPYILSFDEKEQFFIWTSLMFFGGWLLIVAGWFFASVIFYSEVLFFDACKRLLLTFVLVPVVALYLFIIAMPFQMGAPMPFLYVMNGFIAAVGLGVLVYYSDYIIMNFKYGGNVSYEQMMGMKHTDELIRKADSERLKVQALWRKLERMKVKKKE